MEILLYIIIIILLSLVSLAFLYYWILALYALLKNSQLPIEYKKESLTRFAIVIPAHNEENSIESTLRSCKNLKYPYEKFDIYVIADNCTDRTAILAQNAGAQVLERIDPQHRGKGFALEWAFQNLLKKDYDAILVIDADCSIDSNALSVFHNYIVKGAQVLQANDVTSNPDDSPMSYALAIGNFIENELFYVPKSNIGLSVFLRGTGMVFKTDILKRFPWKAHSIVEDLDYSLFLLRHRIRIYFVPEVSVASSFPINHNQLKVQRSRWASGNLKFLTTQLIKIIREGIYNKNWRLVDGGFTLIILSRPIILLGVFLGLLLAFFSYWFIPGSFSQILVIWAISLFLAYIAYILLGIILLGLNFTRLKYLIQTPVLVYRLVRIVIAGLMGNLQDIWIRTPR